MNGVKFDRENMQIRWNGLTIACKMPKKAKSQAYVKEALEHEICYVVIKRMMFNNGWHYYAVLTLKGDAPSKGHSFKNAQSGYDPGISTAAIAGEDCLILQELAPKSKEYNAKLNELDEKIERSRRINNQKNFNENGTVKKGRRKWKNSKTYCSLKRQKRALCRKKSAYIHDSNNRLANTILACAGIHIKAEPVNFSALARKSKNTERQETPSELKDSKGNLIYKYKRKRRFGSSMLDRCPSYMYSMLKKKALNAGGSFTEISTRKFKASQYDHIKDDYIKTGLDMRTKEIGGSSVQRDLYSAFLIKNTDDTLEHPDRMKCISEFDHFISMQNELIENMKLQNITMKECFGF